VGGGAKDQTAVLVSSTPPFSPTASTAAEQIYTHLHIAFSGGHAVRAQVTVGHQRRVVGMRALPPGGGGEVHDRFGRE